MPYLREAGIAVLTFAVAMAGFVFAGSQDGEAVRKLAAENATLMQKISEVDGDAERRQKELQLRVDWLEKNIFRSQLATAAKPDDRMVATLRTLRQNRPAEILFREIKVTGFGEKAEASSSPLSPSGR